jgi:hypothetical protein
VDFNLFINVYTGSVVRSSICHLVVFFFDKYVIWLLMMPQVNCINRKMTKLQQTAARVGPRGLFAIKQKMETYKHEKADLYDMINKAIQENERGGNNGAGPSNRAEPSNRAGPSNEAGTSNDVAGPSNAAIPSSDGAGISNNDAGPSKSNTAIVPSSNCAGPSGSK